MQTMLTKTDLLHDLIKFCWAAGNLGAALGGGAFDAAALVATML